MNKRQILVTAALPYANGPIHLGHIVEYTQADIWVRFQRMRGHHCLYLCGEDAHGTAIMIRAEKECITPDELVNQMQQAHLQDFNDFLVEFDNFHTTHSTENKTLAEQIYLKLLQNGDIISKTVSQAYDPIKNMFLPDRFIKGTCPHCHTADQYGDICENCGATYSPTELKNAVSTISGATPIEKESEHLFFKLARYTEVLLQWINAGHLQPEVANKLKEWFNSGLRPWNISRDKPYFGFQIPNQADKYFYVWLDAPIGYLASLKNLAEKNANIAFDAYWNKNSEAEVYHFVGKDIVYFHALFWPAMLSGINYRLPTAIFVHGYLTINGEKMSKSRGTFIEARKYLSHLKPEYLRYYFSAKLNNQVEDIDLNLQDFALRVNADLVGKYVNLASRSAGFISKKFNGLLADKLPDTELFEEFVNASEVIAKHFESLNYNKAVRKIMALADRANQYIDQQKPWALAKKIGEERQIQLVCTQGLNLFKILSTYLKPILPETAIAVENFLNCDALSWKNIHTPLLNHPINQFKPLMQRIQPEQLNALKQ